MGKKKVKYHILQDIIVKDLVEFIDDIQAQAIRDGVDNDNYQMIDLCNYFITHLINSDSYTDTFNTELPTDDDNDEELPPEAYELNKNKYREDFLDFDASDLSDEEYQKMLSQLDAFLSGWTKTYHKSNSTTSKGKVNLKKYSKELKSDKNLTIAEKFELYYSEYKKQKELKGSKTLTDILDNLGIRKSSGGSDTI